MATIDEIKAALNATNSQNFKDIYKNSTTQLHHILPVELLFGTERPPHEVLTLLTLRTDGFRLNDLSNAVALSTDGLQTALHFGSHRALPANYLTREPYGDRQWTCLRSTPNIHGYISSD